MINRLIPYDTEARPNYWRYQFQHVPVYRDYRFLVEVALRTHRVICGPLVEYPGVPQHVLSPANQSIHVPNFAFYAVWYTASNSWGADAVFTGWSTNYLISTILFRELNISVNILCMVDTCVIDRPK
jgi:hypothetical protein